MDRPYAMSAMQRRDMSYLASLEHRINDSSDRRSLDDCKGKASCKLVAGARCPKSLNLVACIIELHMLVLASGYAHIVVLDMTSDSK